MCFGWVWLATFVGLLGDGFGFVANRCESFVDFGATAAAGVDVVFAIGCIGCCVALASGWALSLAVPCDSLEVGFVTALAVVVALLATSTGPLDLFIANGLTFSLDFAAIGRVTGSFNLIGFSGSTFGVRT